MVLNTLTQILMQVTMSSVLQEIRMYLPPCEAEPSCNMADGQQENEAEEEEMLDGVVLTSKDSELKLNMNMITRWIA